MISKAVEFFTLHSSFFTFLRQVFVNQHSLLDVPDGEDRQDAEEDKCTPMEYGVAHREPIEDVHLVNHIVVAHWDELADSLDRRVHGEEWIGGSADGETYHAPK